jgi:hypothetical protein
MKINELFGNSRIDWTALRNAGAVQPMLYYPGGKDPKTGRIIPPNVNQPNIITAVNLKQKLGPGEKLVPLSTRSMTDDQWQNYMDDWWTKNKNDPDAKNKIDQIKQSAREKNVEFNEWMIMPQTIEPQGLIHLPGRGPNNRFDFKNKGNNRANEYFSGPRTLGKPGYGTAHPLHPSNMKSLSDRFKDKFNSLFNKKKEEPKREWTAFERACMEGGHPLPEDAAGVGTITKQNTTKDVKPGDEYKNVKKLKLEYKEFLENFADGKVKGKSRPGRVKRAGASCAGSVSDLRAKAKRYGGERGKMYHWCANMKSGRKKSQ